jgi:general stress protein 26
MVLRTRDDTWRPDPACRAGLARGCFGLISINSPRRALRNMDRSKPPLLRHAMMNPEQRRLVLRLLDQCKDFALATVTRAGVPEISTVNFASDDLTIYVATGRESAKVRNLQSSAQVALALHGDYEDWSQVKGMSIAAHAEVLADDSAEIQRARQALALKFRQPWDSPSPQDPTSTVYLRITPVRITLLDYEKGFGHRETVVL